MVGPTLRDKYADTNWFNPLKTYASSDVADLNVNDMTTADVAQLVKRASADGIPKTGILVQRRLKKVFASCIAKASAIGGLAIQPQRMRSALFSRR